VQTTLQSTLCFWSGHDSEPSQNQTGTLPLGRDAQPLRTPPTASGECLLFLIQLTASRLLARHQHQQLAFLLEVIKSPVQRGIIGNISKSRHLSRMVNLTTLAPGIVTAILDETLPSEVTLFDLASGTPLLWDEQRDLLYF